MHETYPGASVTDRIESTFSELVRDVNSASAAARNGWIFFMALLAYFFISLAGITHRDLLLETPVQLPMLQVGIALKAFFVFAPVILVLMHFSMLLQHVMLSRKLKELHDRVTRYEGASFFRTHRVRIQLHSYFYSQAIAGPQRSPLFAAFLHAMTWGTLGLLPLVLLLDFQVTFLPYHDLAVTWAHRLILVADFLVVLVFGVFLCFPDRSFIGGLGTVILRYPGPFAAMLLVWCAALFFSFIVATIPDERMDRAMAALPIWRVPVPSDSAKSGARRFAFWPTAALFEGAVDRISGRPASLFGRNLVVTDADLGRSSGISLRRRDLRYATFDRSDLSRADVTGAVLAGASLRAAILFELKAEQADLRGADLWRARLVDDTTRDGLIVGADLRGADLRQANLAEADLRGAGLLGAVLDGATLRDTRLQGALLDSAHLAEAQRQGAQF